MIIYKESKKQFVADVFNDCIEEKINKMMIEKMHRHTGEAEYRSWANSMQYMYKVMDSDSIPDDVDVAIEYRIPNSNKRVDFIVAGEGENGEENAVVIELKQWQSAQRVVDKNGLVRTVLGGSLRETTHPSYQAWSYVSMIQDYNEDVRKYHIDLEPCTYLHNYVRSENDPLLDRIYSYYTRKAPVFMRGDALKLREYITKYIKKANNKTLYEIEFGRIKPSKSLQDTMVNLLAGKEEFKLIDEQKVIFEQVLSLAKLNDNKKRTVIIHGGPGTGKSVLAINLLAKTMGELASNSMYVTKNQAPRSVYSEKLQEGNYRKATIDNLFKGSGSFIDTPANFFDSLFIDEAHRLNAKSGMFSNKGENQVKELINAAKLSVFFVDDHQQVTLKDIGSTDEIKKWAHFYHTSVYEYTLASQFRCNGSDGYLNWIDDVLEVQHTANDVFDLDYDIRVYDDPNEVYQEVLKHNDNNKARMLAGYCWNWLKDGKADSTVHDIEIPKFDFGMSWNLGSTSTWAIDKDSVNEVGCIHTCQGLEFDYVGVIIGDDMRYENGHIITDFTKRAKTDKSLFGIKKLYKEQPEEALKRADHIIKNTYRTLLTRGQKGCFIYCTDSALANYFKARLNYK